MEKSKILIIGAGIAGVTAAEQARLKNPSAHIEIYDEESHLPYYRLRLSSEIGKNFMPQEIALHSESWYEDRQITFHLGAKVTSVDIEDKYVVVNGEKKFFDRLILAQGSHAFIPPLAGSDLRGVFAVRKLSDVLDLNEIIKNPVRCIVIGGGVLGLEVAWALRKVHQDVTVIEHNSILLNKQLDEEGADFLANKATEAGIKLLLGKATSSINGVDKVQSVTLTDGSLLPADIIILSTGIRPNLDIVKASGINIGRNIIVNNRMETNIKDIYAAGDVAEFNSQAYGLWGISREQGKVAGINAAGGSAIYEPSLPSSALMVFDTRVLTLGEIAQSGEELVSVASKEKNVFKKLFFRNNVLVGAIFIGDIKDGQNVKKMIDDKYQVEVSGKITPDEIIVTRRNL